MFSCEAGSGNTSLPGELSFQNDELLPRAPCALTPKPNTSALNGWLHLGSLSHNPAGSTVCITADAAHPVPLSGRAHPVITPREQQPSRASIPAVQRFVHSSKPGSHPPRRLSDAETMRRWCSRMGDQHLHHLSEVPLRYQGTVSFCF